MEVLKLKNPPPDIVPVPHPPVTLPKAVVDTIKGFQVDKRTGNVTLNIRDGKILGLHAEEIVKI